MGLKKLKQIITVSKRVEISGGGKLHYSIGRTDETKDRIKELIKYITHGKAIPEDYYSEWSAEQDELLDSHGIIHLVLTDTDRLYLLQYDRKVVFLEVSDHRYLDRLTGTSDKRAEPLLTRHADEFNNEDPPPNAVSKKEKHKDHDVERDPDKIKAGLNPKKKKP